MTFSLFKEENLKAKANQAVFGIPIIDTVSVPTFITPVKQF
jgi:hypothetical protein